mmetsp:Transcript_25424/g.57775  ORF Transcript_25424/g.57775 Transcript_25424/m.57775 type:complete len:244 (-) Transcript_25424:7-738(-)
MPALRLAVACTIGCATICGSVRLQKEERLESRFASREEPKKYSFNCTRFPAACKEPFNCQKGPKYHGPNAPYATEDEHADYRTWCDSPESYIEPALQCQQGNLREYGRLMHQTQKSASPVVELVDAHYCFQHGHCDNDDIGPNTTLAEAEAICDEKFGHNRWTQLENLAVSGFDIRLSMKGLYLSHAAEESFAMMACAMGNYHCDAIYCKQEYCSKSEWRVRYGEARPKAGHKAHGKHYPNNY